MHFYFRNKLFKKWFIFFLPLNFPFTRQFTRFKTTTITTENAVTKLLLPSYLPNQMDTLILFDFPVASDTVNHSFHGVLLYSEFSHNTISWSSSYLFLLSLLCEPLISVHQEPNVGNHYCSIYFTSSKSDLWVFPYTSITWTTTCTRSGIILSLLKLISCHYISHYVTYAPSDILVNYSTFI